MTVYANFSSDSVIKSSQKTGVDQLVDVTKSGEIAHALWVQDAIEMVAFVLHHACVKTLGLHLDRRSTGVETLVLDVPVSGDHCAHAWYAETAFPAFFRGVFQWVDHRIDQNR
jgi:hypothetical protein